MTRRARGWACWGRHPDIKWRRGVRVTSLACRPAQLALLEAQRPCLAADGLLVYSVCSNEPEETCEVVRIFLDRHPDLELDPLAADLPGTLRQPSSTRRNP